jgi:hypothetical protein
LNGEIINGAIYKPEKSPAEITEQGCLLLGGIIKTIASVPSFETWIK